MNEVLLLSRHLPHEDLITGLASALKTGALTADAIALEARKAADADAEPEAQPLPVTLGVSPVSPRYLLPSEPICRPTDARCPPSPATTSSCDSADPTVPPPEEENAVSLPRQRGLTEQAATTAVDQACRMLRRLTIRSQFPELAEQAEREQMSYLGFLAELLLAECDDRAGARSAASRPRGSPTTSRSASSTSTPIPTSTRR